MWGLWISIALIVIVLMVIFKFKEIRHKFGLVIVAFILIFFLITFSSIYVAHKTDLKSFDGVIKVSKIYFSWLGSVFKNVVKVSGYAIHQDWGLNITNSTKTK